MATDLDVLFWQRLLASEAPPERTWPVAELFWSRADDPWSPLTDRERDNAFAARVPETVTVDRLSVLDARLLPSLFPRHGCTPGAFALGNPAALDRTLIGIVGTRAASPYGKEVASAFAREFTRAGACVVSGGAIGIDVAAHTAALEAGGATVAVLPCGADVDYPARHRDVFAKVRELGCVLSRFPLGSGLREHWLPWRNRLVAQICRALVVVEAPDGSGALMTAGYAAGLGTPVFVVPGPVTGAGFKGSHDLVRAGAVLVHDPAQVTGPLGLERPLADACVLGCGTVEARVLQAVKGLPRSAESIGDETGLPATDVLSALTLLEIEGAVFKSVEGYARKA